MKRFRGALHTLLLIILSCSLHIGCSSSDARLVSKLPEKPTRLGPARGTASGVLIFAVLPFGVNSRTYRAYKDALAQVPEATALTDVTLEEFWIYFGVGYFQQVTITGEAVK